MTVTLTEKAALKLRTVLYGNSNNITGIRVGVKDGGCNGHEYALNLVKEVNSEDVRFEQDDVPIYVDPESASLLDGVVIDFVDSLTQSGFTFTNPNATQTCGCGKSFATANCGGQAASCG